MKSKVLFGVGLWLVLALATIIPFSGASEENFLGYMSLCTYAPVSTIICLGVGAWNFIKILKIKRQGILE